MGTVSATSKYEELRNHPDVIYQRDQLQKNHGGYPQDNMGFAREVVAMTNLLDTPEALRPTSLMYQFVKKNFVIQREKAIRDCIIPALEDILDLHGCQLTNSQRFETLFSSNYEEEAVNDDLYVSTEGEYIHRLVEDNPHLVRNFSETTRKNWIAERDRRATSTKANNPIRMVYLDRPKFKEFIKGSKRDVENLPFDLFTIRMKSFESLLLKLLERNRRIYVPTDEDLDKMRRKGYHDKLDPNEIFGHYERWLKAVFESGEDLNRIIEGYKEEDVKVDGLQPTTFIHGPGTKKSDTKYGGNLNNAFRGPFPDDVAGLGGYTRSRRDLPAVHSKIFHQLTRVRQIHHQFEDTLRGEDDKKDGSLVYSVTSSDDRLIGQLRVKSMHDLGISEVGSEEIKAHSPHKHEQIALIEKAVDSRDKKKQERVTKFINIADNAFELFELEPEDIGIKSKALTRKRAHSRKTRVRTKV